MAGSNGVWNQVFSGVVGAPAQCFPAAPACGGPYTTLATSPVTREAPYLYVDAAGDYRVFVPAVAARLRGHDLGQRPDARHARSPSTTSSSPSPRTPSTTINEALAEGRNLLFTPGIYQLDQTDQGEARGHRRARPRLPDARADPRQRGDDRRRRPGREARRADVRRRPGELAGPARGGPEERAQERPRRPDDAQRRVLPHRRGDPGQGHDEPRREQRRRHPRRHLGLAGRPRQRRGLDGQHRRHGGDRQRRRRHGVRPVRRALPAHRDDLERPGRAGRLLPERDALRPAEPGGVDGGTGRPRLRRLQDRRHRDQLQRLRHGQLQLLQPGHRHLRRERLRGARRPSRPGASTTC